MCSDQSTNLRRQLTAAAVWTAAVCATIGIPAAQQAEHVSSVVEKLSRGERIFGVSTYDLSLENARALARSDIDYVYVDMEHGAMDFAALQTFLLGMTDDRQGGRLRDGQLAAESHALGPVCPVWA